MLLQAVQVQIHNFEKKTIEVLPLLLANYHSHLLNIVSYVLHGQYHNFPETVQVPSNDILLLHIDKAHFHCIQTRLTVAPLETEEMTKLNCIPQR